MSARASYFIQLTHLTHDETMAKREERKTNQMNNVEMIKYIGNDNLR